MTLWNGTKTFLLLAVLTGLLVFLGNALAGPTGLVLGLLIAGTMNFVSYWFSHRILLRMNGAREVGPADEPDLHNTLHRLAMRAEMPVPRLYLIPEDAPNAFATGRNPENAAVAVTAGLVKLLSKPEVEGVIAHELAHIRNRDTLIMTVAAGLGGALGMIANMAAWGVMLGQGRGSDDESSGSSAITGLFGLLVAPVAAAVVQMAISRSREYDADASGAQITGNPLALAAALQKIESWSRQKPLTVNSAAAHMFIINPLTGRGISRLFSTHPSTAERVLRLESMAGLKRVA